MKLWSYVKREIVDVPAHLLHEFWEQHVIGPRDTWVRGFSDPFVMLGSALITLWNPDGTVKDARCLRNLVTTSGRGWAIDRFQGTSVGVADYIGLGTGTNAAAAGDTTLQTEIGTRVQGSLTQPTATEDLSTATFAAGNATGAITEAARFTAVSGGVLVGRLVFSVVNKGAGDPLTVEYKLTT